MFNKLLFFFIIFTASYSFALTHFYGVNTIAKDSVLNDDLYIHADAIVQPDNNYFRVLTVKGSIINEGTIQNDLVNGQYFYVYAEGDVTNLGTWGGRNLVLSGTFSQSIESGELNPFEPTGFISQNSAGLIAGSNINVRNCNVALNDNSLDLEGFSFNLHSSSLKNAVIIGGNGSVIRGELDSFLENTTASDIILEGVLDISSSVLFSGITTNYAEIKNHYNYNAMPNFTGDLNNYGTITDNYQNFFYPYVQGNIYNDGVITCRNLIMNGTSLQTVSCSDSTFFEPDAFISQNSVGIQAISDIYFNNCNIRGGNNSLDLNGFNAYINSGNSIEIKYSNGTINLSLGSCLENTVLEDITIEGTALIGYNNQSYGELVNNSVLQNDDGNFRTLVVHGNLTNNSVMTTNTAGDLYVHAYGNITNTGTMDYYQTLVKGNTDQAIIIPNGAPIENFRLYLTSELETAPFEWQYNLAPLDLPETGNESTFQMHFENASIDEPYFGTYHCETGEGASRKIYIYNGVFPAPVITSGSHENETSEINWENIPSAVSYKVYSSDDPYADQATWTYETEVFTNSCTLTNQTAQKKFHFVKAIY
ncbi:MAG: hypothetical protein PF638_07975 [Candidatus Delongbacteria bacterium]|nr:hypothetical protein [Candidatus Delongbacteria bacterium]